MHKALFGMIVIPITKMQKFLHTVMELTAATVNKSG